METERAETALKAHRLHVVDPTFSEAGSALAEISTRDSTSKRLQPRPREHPSALSLANWKQRNQTHARSRNQTHAAAFPVQLVPGARMLVFDFACI